MKIEEWNANCSVSKDSPIEPNLKGFIVGNGYTDPKYDRIDNAIDMAHIHYLHSDSFGNKDKPVIKGMTVAKDAFEINASFA